MPRLTTAVPKYRRHNKKYAIVRINGHEFYLGAYGSKASRAEYDRLIAEWISNGRQLPRQNDATKIVQLCAMYHRHAQEYYRGKV